MKSGNCYKFSLALSALCILGFATTQPADADTPKYTILDLGTVSDSPNDGGNLYTSATGINNSGQVVGYGSKGKSILSFRTAPNSPINRATDDLGTLGGNSPFGPVTFANGINKSGQVVGYSLRPLEGGSFQEHAFRTAPNSPINPATDDLGVLGGGTLSSTRSVGNAINKSGQVVGYSTTDSGQTHAFRTAPNSPINPATDDLGVVGGTLSSTESVGNAINKSGQVVGYSTTDTNST